MEESGRTGARGLFYVDFKWVCFGNLYTMREKARERERTRGEPNKRQKRERRDVCVPVCAYVNI